MKERQERRRKVIVINGEETGKKITGIVPNNDTIARIRRKYRR